MREDLNCAYAVQAVGPRTPPPDSGFYLYLTEQYNTCQTVDSSASSGGSKVFLSWCTIPVAGQPGVYSLYRENLLGSGTPTSTCDSSGTLEATDLVAPSAGWPTNTAAATPSTWNGNIWPTSLITCTSSQTNYLPTVGVDMAVNPDPSAIRAHIRVEGSAHTPERDAVRHVRQHRRHGNAIRSIGADARLADRRLGLHGDPHRRSSSAAPPTRPTAGRRRSRSADLPTRHPAARPSTRRRSRSRTASGPRRSRSTTRPRPPSARPRHEDRQLDVHSRRRYGGQAALERSLR